MARSGAPLLDVLLCRTGLLLRSTQPALSILGLTGGGGFAQSFTMQTSLRRSLFKLDTLTLAIKLSLLPKTQFRTSSTSSAFIHPLLKCNELILFLTFPFLRSNCAPP